MARWARRNKRRLRNYDRNFMLTGLRKPDEPPAAADDEAPAFTVIAIDEALGLDVSAALELIANATAVPSEYFAACGEGAVKSPAPDDARPVGP